MPGGPASHGPAGDAAYDSHVAEPSVGARAFDPTPEARFRGLFENLPEALLVQAMDGTILEANPAAADLYGYEQAELVGRDARELVAGVDEAG